MTSKLLIKHGLVVTVGPEDSIFRDGSVYIEDNIIKEGGPSKDLGEKEGAEVIDATGKVVIPGFVSCHNHLYSSVVRSIPASGFDNVDFSLISWMERFSLPQLEDRVTQEQMYVGTLANLIELVFQQPYCRIASVVEAGIAERKTASLYLQQLERIGVLAAEKRGRGIIYRHTALLEVLAS